MSETRKEHERKWLVTEVPRHIIEKLHEQKIRQGYLAITDNGSIRIRSIECDGLVFYSMTMKTGKGITREEVEHSLAQELFDQLWPEIKHRLEKRRYSWVEDGCQLDLDLYDGPLEGLVTIEAESPVKPYVVQFQPLGWFGREVTEVPEYTNAMLAAKGLPQDA